MSAHQSMSRARNLSARIRRSRAAFTLVELLVVIAIIGMLMALLLPAVNAAREAGRRNTCQNNIRQVALALKNYESVRQTMPGVANYKPSQGDTSGTLYARPLLYEIAPQLERNDIYETLNRENYVDHIPPTTTNPPLPFLALMVCPSDFQNTGPVTAYVYNYGHASAGPNRVRNKANGIFDDANPQFNFSTPLSFVNTADGETQTVMLSENIDARFWIDIDPLRVTFAWQDVQPVDYIRVNINRNKGLSINTANDDLIWDFCRPSSNHPQVVNVAYCDAHVRPINDSIDYGVWVAMMAPKHSQATALSNQPVQNVLAQGTPLRLYLFDESHVP